MEPKGYNHPYEAKKQLDTLNLDLFYNKIFINPLENKRFVFNRYRIKHFNDKYYIMVTLTKLNPEKGENIVYEVDYETFISVLIGQ